MYSPVHVFITEVKTGECRLHVDRFGWFEDGAYDDYMWSEGSYACDCNRELFFRRAHGESVSSMEFLVDRRGGRACGMDRFEVRIQTPEGQLLYRDEVIGQ